MLIYVIQISLSLVVSWLLEFPAAFRMLLSLQVLDILAGVLSSGTRQEIRSSIAWNGIRKKAFSWILVIAVLVLESQLDTLFPVFIAGMLPSEVIASLFSITEVISIVENAEDLGIPLPGWLVSSLANRRKELSGDSNTKK